MKYSLKDRQFKKRQPIFDKNENKSFLSIQQQIEQTSKLDEHKKSKRDKLHVKQISIQKQESQSSSQLKAKQSIQKVKRNTSRQGKIGKHNLKPNPRPTVPIINDTKSKFLLSDKKTKLTIQSEVIFFCQYPEVRPKDQNRMIIQKLYHILLQNSKKLDVLTYAITKMAQLWVKSTKLASNNINFLQNLENRIVLNFNTIRNINDVLRITTIKQQNLQLIFKQQAEPKKRNISRESQKFVRLLQCQSEAENFMLQKQQSDQIISKNYFSNQSRHRVQNKNSKTNTFQKNIESFPAKMQTYKKSPFQANQMIKISKNFEEKTKNLQNLQYDEIVSRLNGIAKFGFQGWRDEMGCLRRTNSSYLFDRKGSVINLSQNCYEKLVKNGWLLRSK